jgi:hypothetical protein
MTSKFQLFHAHFATCAKAPVYFIQTRIRQNADIQKTTGRNFSPPIASQVQVGSSMQLTLTEGIRMAQNLKYFAVTLMLLIALSFTFERQAHAYVDPGSGLLIFQGISAVFSGALFYFRRRLKNLFVRTPKGLPQSSRPS